MSRVSKTSFLKYFRIAYLSGPNGERTLYRQMAKHRPCNILEIGLGLGVRTLRMFEVAGRYSQSSEINYTGIDLFESRPANSASLSLKDAYKLLRQQGVKVKLIPGDALAAMTMVANTLTNTDLIVIDSDIKNEDLANAWKYFPRMMHERTLVMRQECNDRGKQFKKLSALNVETLIQESTMKEESSKAA